MSQQHNLPVTFLKLLNSGGKTTLELFPGGRCGWGQFPVNHRIGNRRRHPVIWPSFVDRHLPIDTSTRRHSMSPVGIDQPVTSHMPQPEPKRHHGIFQIVTQPAVRLDHHVLHDVAGINPALHNTVHSRRDQATDRIAMPSKQALNSIGITLPHAVEQHLRDLWIGRLAHGASFWD